MAKYIEITENEKYPELCKATVIPDNFWEHIRLIWYSLFKKTNVHFRIFVSKDFLNKNVKPINK